MDTTRKRSNWLVTGLLLVASLTVLAPMYFTVITAVKDPTDMRGNLWLPPSRWNWSNFAEAIDVTNFGQALANSLLVTVGVVVLAILTNSLVGYAIARNLHRRAFKAMYYYLLSALFIPFPIVMLPLVKQMSALGMDNIWGLILLYVVYNLAFNTLLYTGYLQTIPVALEEAAMLDGAGPWTTFWRVIFPLLTPINATVAILTGLMTWNDFLLPLVILSDASQYTLPLAQYAFQGQFSTDYNLAFASYLMALTPMLIIYLFAQRWIIGGVARGAVK
ncbi:MAG: carbohydrate ABC transporter permease [Actinomyces sp.]|jgi:raffinose/stachyose/melibiose transport system permease protein|nr:carbohydrate ABC transporter permease [Actinomyces sp.]MCI1787216.1 carbohydrate ABC transporter permease [Actinomyces sp.]MCI1829610.1 carbohydrate ABC transporter permease [Actinomyces sp.]MCI1866693.1 carbohydrate ABC transporter permease [Actinomyces sp.]